MRIDELIAEINHTLVSAFGKLSEWLAAPPHLRDYRPTNGGWTINEILEHVALTNHYLLILIEKGATKALKNVQKLDLSTELAHHHLQRAKLDEVGLHLSFPWVRPDHMHPKGLQTTAEVSLTLQEQLLRCHQVLGQLPNGEGVLYRTTMTVNGLGKLDVYEFVYFLAKHAERHLTQIEKIILEHSGSER